MMNWSSMIEKLKCLIVLFTLELSCNYLQAQDKVTNKLELSPLDYPLTMECYYVGVGGVMLKDAYLSPLSYGGTQLSLRKEKTSFARLPNYRPYQFKINSWCDYFSPKLYQELFSPQLNNSINKKFISHSITQVNTARSYNPIGNAAILSIGARYNQSLMYSVMDNFCGKVFVGIGSELNLMTLYQSRNGNNPVDIDASIGLTANLYYTYRLPWDKCPMLFKIASATSLLGLRHSIGYGESYYFAYGGEKFELLKHLYFTSFHNQLSQNLQTAIEIPISKFFTLDLAYHLYWEQSSVGNRAFNQMSNSFQIGFTRYILELNEDKVFDHNIENLCF